MASTLPLPPILENLLKPANVPPVLYHYTTQAGLLGIIKSREIWATHTQYLNDSQEFKHAIGVAMSQVAVKLAAESDEDRKTVLQEMLDGLMLSIETINVFVCSFSECADSLAQWRAYGDATGGFAVGFRGEYLAQRVLSENHFLVRCIPVAASRSMRSRVAGAPKNLIVTSNLTFLAW